MAQRLTILFSPPCPFGGGAEQKPKVKAESTLSTYRGSLVSTITYAVPRLPRTTLAPAVVYRESVM